MSELEMLFQRAKVNSQSLAILREPFPAHQISKLPKPTKAETEELKANYKAGTRCLLCGGWHQPKVVHLDYVGHAALTDRLLDADPMWNWEPMMGADGIPRVDQDGGMWIKLTVCGVTRLGYGDAQGKTGPNATKERIGDALRNAAMRFGCALDLWHKGDLHIDEPEPKPEKAPHAHSDTPQVVQAHEAEEWNQDNTDVLWDLLGQGADDMKLLGMSETDIAKWEARYKGQKAQGDTPSKVIARVGESLAAIQKKVMALKTVNEDAEPPEQNGSTKDIISKSWLAIVKRWRAQGMNEVHVGNKIKKLTAEWIGDHAMFSPEADAAIIVGQNILLAEFAT